MTHLTSTKCTLIGRNVTISVTGLVKHGVITAAHEDKYAINLDVQLDSPVQWGDQYLTKATPAVRKFDKYTFFADFNLVEENGQLKPITADMIIDSIQS